LVFLHPCPFHCSCCNLFRHSLLLHSFNMTTQPQPEGFYKIYKSSPCNMYFIPFFVLILPCSPSVTGAGRKTQLSTFYSAPIERQLVKSYAWPNNKVVAVQVVWYSYMQFEQLVWYSYMQFEQLVWYSYMQFEPQQYVERRSKLLYQPYGSEQIPVPR
jgi:hypothetical protein